MRFQGQKYLRVLDQRPVNALKEGVQACTAAIQIDPLRYLLIPKSQFHLLLTGDVILTSRSSLTSR